MRTSQAFFYADFLIIWFSDDYVFCKKIVSVLTPEIRHNRVWICAKRIDNDWIVGVWRILGGTTERGKTLHKRLILNECQPSFSRNHATITPR